MNTRLLSVGLLLWGLFASAAAEFADEPALVVEVRPVSGQDGWSAWQLPGAVMDIEAAYDPIGWVDAASDSVRVPVSGYWRQTVVSRGETNLGPGASRPQELVQWIEAGSLARVRVARASPEVVQVRYWVPDTRIRWEYLGRGIGRGPAGTQTREG